MSMTCLPSSTKDDRKFGQPPPPPNRFAAALFGILSCPTPHCTGTILADTLLLAHHPIVCHSAKGAASLWGGIQTCAFGGVRHIDHILEDEVCATDVATCVVRTMHGDLDNDRCVPIMSLLLAFTAVSENMLPPSTFASLSFIRPIR